MQKISSQKLAEIVGATSRIFQTEIENVVTDSRIAQKGDLFVAIRGEKNDGHNYAADVLKKGAELVMVDHIVPIRFGGRSLDMDNLQSLCWSCHSAKSIKEGSRFGKRPR